MSSLTTSEDEETLIVAKIRELPERTQYLLQLGACKPTAASFESRPRALTASCMGTNCDLGRLALVAGTDVNSVSRGLYQAFVAGLIVAPGLTV